MVFTLKYVACKTCNASHGLSACSLGLTLTQSADATKDRTKIKATFSFFAESSLINLYLKQENQNSSILLATKRYVPQLKT